MYMLEVDSARLSITFLTKNSLFLKSLDV